MEKAKKSGQTMFPVLHLGRLFLNATFTLGVNLTWISYNLAVFFHLLLLIFRLPFHLHIPSFALSPVSTSLFFSRYQGNAAQSVGGCSCGSDKAGNSKSMQVQSTVCRLPASFTHSWMWVILKAPNGPVLLVINKCGLGWEGGVTLDR